MSCHNVVEGLDVTLYNVYAAGSPQVANRKLQLASTADWLEAFASMPLVAEIPKQLLTRRTCISPGVRK